MRTQAGTDVAAEKARGLLIDFLAYAGLGFLSIILLFCVVSIPMMERHNLERRADYAAYRARTPVLIPFPRKETRE